MESFSSLMDLLGLGTGKSASIRLATLTFSQISLHPGLWQDGRKCFSFTADRKMVQMCSRTIRVASVTGWYSCWVYPV